MRLNYISMVIFIECILYSMCFTTNLMTRNQELGALCIMFLKYNKTMPGLHCQSFSLQTKTNFTLLIYVIYVKVNFKFFNWEIFKVNHQKANFGIFAMNYEANVRKLLVIVTPSSEVFLYPPRTLLCKLSLCWIVTWSNNLLIGSLIYVYSMFILLSQSYIYILLYSTINYFYKWPIYRQYEAKVIMMRDSRKSVYFYNITDLDFFKCCFLMSNL